MDYMEGHLHSPFNNSINIYYIYVWIPVRHFAGLQSLFYTLQQVRRKIMKYNRNRNFLTMLKSDSVNWSKTTDFSKHGQLKPSYLTTLEIWQLYNKSLQFQLQQLQVATEFKPNLAWRHWCSLGQGRRLFIS